MSADVLLCAPEMGKRVYLSGKTILQIAREGKIPCLMLTPRTIRFDPEQVIAALKKKGARK